MQVRIKLLLLVVAPAEDKEIGVKQSDSFSVVNLACIEHYSKFVSTQKQQKMAMLFF